MSQPQTLEEKMTQSLWHRWQTQGTHTKMTYLEVLHLAQFVTSCRNYADISSFDFEAYTDSQISYDENLEQFKAMLHPSAESDKLTMARIAEEAEIDLKTIQQLEEDNKRLQRLHQNDLKKLREVENQQRSLEDNVSDLQLQLKVLAKDKEVEKAVPEPVVVAPIEIQDIPMSELPPAPPMPNSVKDQYPRTIEYTPEELREIMEYVWSKAEVEKADNKQSTLRKLKSAWQFIKDVAWCLRL